MGAEGELRKAPEVSGLQGTMHRRGIPGKRAPFTTHCPLLTDMHTHMHTEDLGLSGRGRNLRGLEKILVCN